MSETPDNLVLVLLRRVDEKLDRLSTDMLEVKERLGFLESAYASISRRVDKLDERLERIEKRLGLIDA